MVCKISAIFCNVSKCVKLWKTPPFYADHDDVIKWKHFPRYWPFVWGIHRSPVNSPHKGQWRGALMFTLICARINCWVNNREAGDLRRNRHRNACVHFSKYFPLLGQHCVGVQHTFVHIDTLLTSRHALGNMYPWWAILCNGLRPLQQVVYCFLISCINIVAHH